MANVSIALVAASSVVPRLDLETGADRLRAANFDVFCHPQCFDTHFTYAGDDQQRANALWQVANDNRFNIIWLARGGYGAARLLPLLDALTAQHGPPPRKLLVGYSDVTVLHEYARTRWHWPTLHAPMPAATNFGLYDPAHWRALLDLINGKHPGRAWGDRPLKWLNVPATAEVELVGGNLALWSSIAGTPYAPTPGRNRLVFFEDIGEKYYRIDRMLTQIRQAGLLDGVAALILGDFTNCDDDAPQLVRGPDDTKIPLRRQFSKDEAFTEIFASLPFPVATGLPVGHGPNFAPLPLGATYRAAANGSFELIHWDWLET
ncbi:MAG: Muramoyltetrapeptide carboxypeptidase [Phycisphaerales bacterium]|nr:Muramoyltetrapeptide carboxypeptidase [Phycisphaerales bacterium]